MGNQLQLWACARTLSLRYGWRFLYNRVQHQADFALPRTQSNPLRARLRQLGYILRRRVVPLHDHEWDASFNLNGQVRPQWRHHDGVLFQLSWGGIFKDLTEFRPRLIQELLGDHHATIPSLTDASAIGIHIRRTDAEYPLPLTYYANAVRCGAADSGRKPVLHLYSDGDLEMLRGDLSALLPGYEMVLHRGRAVEDMLALARFQQIVISTSWFSYWSAYLSHEARIYCPAEFQYYARWHPVIP